jgi:hypothetical protein
MFNLHSLGLPATIEIWSVAVGDWAFQELPPSLLGKPRINLHQNEFDDYTARKIATLARTAKVVRTTGVTRWRGERGKPIRMASAAITIMIVRVRNRKRDIGRSEGINPSLR